jgi:tetratricopeptide (TPR) repeat protein
MSAPDALPDSLAPLEMALDQDRGEGAHDNAARSLLVDQGRLVRWQIASERAGVGLKLLSALVGLAVAVALAAMVVSATRSRTVVVEAFDAPPALAERGLSGKVMAGGVQDALTTIQTALRTTASKRQVSNAWTGDIAVQVASTGVSIGEIDRLLKAKLGHDTHVGGDLIQNRNGSLALTVRGSGILPRTFTGGPDDLPKLSVQAAEYVYGSAEPYLFASYLAQRGRNEEAIAFIERVFPTAPEAIRAGLANSWANALGGMGDDPGAIAKYRLAIRLDPYFWKPRGNLIGALWAVEGEESAYQEGRRMQAAIAARPRGSPAPELLDLQNFYPQVQDWRVMHDALVQDQATTNGGAGTLISGPAIADAATRLHDEAGADHALVVSDPEDPVTVAQRALTPGWLALMDKGRPADALAHMRAFDAQWRSEPDVSFTYLDGPCYVGLAYALNGLAAQAAEAFTRGGRQVACYAFQADALEAAGDRAGADAGYARAVRLAPSLPFAYQRWGLALERRGDLRGAAAKFAAAHQRGSHWADPLKSQGEVLAAQGRWREAVAKYDAALKWAPNWARLRGVAAKAHAQAKRL